MTNHSFVDSVKSMYIRSLIGVDDRVVVAIPRDYVEELELSVGMKVMIELGDDYESIVIRKLTRTIKNPSRNIFDFNNFYTPAY